MSDAGRLVRIRPETARGLEVVQRGLELAMSRVGAGEITSKGGRDLVTAADVAVEDAVRALVGEATNGTIVGEERGGSAPSDGSAYWLVDPICGTSNYAAGMSLYCVNLALVEHDEVTVAVVGDASTGSLMFAERGVGAFSYANGLPERVHASAALPTLVVEDGKSHGARREHAGRFMAAAVQADRWHFRSIGSSLSLPFVADGRAAAYVVFYITDVHAAPGSLLVSEAGGVLTDIEGRPWTLRSDSMLAAATPELHAELLSLVRATGVTSR